VSPSFWLTLLSLTKHSPAETQAQFDTNVFGLLNVTRAFLPYFRAQRSGVIGNVSSIGAWRGGAGIGLYCTSKWAVSGISETLTYELADFNIKVCAIEPGYFRSNFLNPGNRLAAKAHIPDYDGTAARKTAAGLEAYNNNQPGDIKKGAKVMVDVLTSSGVAAGKEVPLRLALGTDAYGIITGKCQDTMSLLDEWKHISTTTDHV
jgi:NAD(P)-dependent dehydrogenase (short-subunit alcohol dehydrogenase family)